VTEISTIPAVVGVVLGVVLIIWFELNEDRIVRAWARFWLKTDTDEGDNR
jgi:integral membrane sensor domain MASE1